MTTIFIITLAAALIAYAIIKKLSAYRNPVKDKKELIEHALKILYETEEKKENYSKEALAKRLKANIDETTNLISHLIEHKLIEKNNENYNLTKEGKNYALKVIRVHRLWEKYLAEQTSIPAKDWHKIADKREHKLTNNEIDTLSAQLGNPFLDPHGDPIPDSNGTMPNIKSILLNQLETNHYGIITHIEDEPKEIYAQLFALGLYPGQQVKIIEKTNSKIIFEADGEECILAPLLANNISVKEISFKEITKSFRNLASIKQGETAIVEKISNSLRGQQRRRLMDFGIVPGTKITKELISTFGDPVAFKVRGTTIALRKEQAEQIFIKPLENYE